MIRRLIILSLLYASPVWAEVEPSILNPSGLPIPRYVVLKFNEVNVRVGPGQRYPIRYVYHRKHLPVQIVEEFAHWRKIKDFEGDTGWVHKNMLDGKRTAIIVDHTQNLYHTPEVTPRPALRAEPNVIGELQRCTPDWCALTLEDHTAWIRKEGMWGVNREEVFER